MIRLDARSLVVLVGASAAGKSSWAASWFRPEQVVSSDTLRASVGESQRDQRASEDAFDVLDAIVAARLSRRLLTVVDSTGLTESRRGGWLAQGRAADVPVVAVVFEETQAELKRRNRQRQHPVPDRVVVTQARAVRSIRDDLVAEGWTVVAPDDVAVVPRCFVEAPAAARRQEEAPMSLTFGLSVPRFAWEGGGPVIADRLREVAVTAEQVGFASIHLMDHVVQIPSFGPAWEPMLESTTTLGWLAGVTDRVRLGPLVAAVPYRSIMLLGKAIATLDVLSGGRAMCGLGIGWFEREATLYDLPFPPRNERYELLEDALRLLPLLWGPGTPAFEGHHVQVPEAVCYPRPLQDPRPPILVGGVGEQRTLRLVAEHADACNLPGDAELVTRKLEVLHTHCHELDRDPTTIEVTQLSTTLVGRDADEVARLVEEHRAADQSPETHADRVNAGTTGDQIGRFRELAEAGVDHAIVSVPPLTTVESVERFAPIIEAFA